jgi:hypothetical protein
VNKRDAKFLHRILVLSIVAIVTGIGVVVVKSSAEMEKVVEPSGYRDALLILSPLCGLFLTGYLSGVLTAIAGGHKQADIKELLPWNYTAPV